MKVLTEADLFALAFDLESLREIRKGDKRYNGDEYRVLPGRGFEPCQQQR